MLAFSSLLSLTAKALTQIVGLYGKLLQPQYSLKKDLLLTVVTLNSAHVSGLD